MPLLLKRKGEGSVLLVIMVHRCWECLVFVIGTPRVDQKTAFSGPVYALTGIIRLSEQGSDQFKISTGVCKRSLFQNGVIVVVHIVAAQCPVVVLNTITIMCKQFTTLFFF